MLLFEALRDLNIDAKGGEADSVDVGIRLYLRQSVQLGLSLVACSVDQNAGDPT